jgi:hypothetical protein
MQPSEQASAAHINIAKPPEDHQFPTIPKAKPSADNSPFVVLGALMAVLCLGYLIFGGSSTKKEHQKTDDCNDSIAAFVYGNRFVEQRLKAPATAKFPYISDSGVSVRSSGNCTHTVTGYVDAQNSFGALIRSQYNVTVQYTNSSSSWRLVSIEINN